MRNLSRAVAVVCLLVVVSCTSSTTTGMKIPVTDIGKEVPVIRDVQITPRGPDVPKQTAALSGVWEGRWGGKLASRLIVERVTAHSAAIIYEWGDLPGAYGFKRGSLKQNAEVTSPGVLHWMGVADMTFKMSRDDKTVSGSYVRPGAESTVVMRKLAL